MNIYPIVKELGLPLGSLAVGSLIGRFLGKEIVSFAGKDLERTRIQNSVAPFFQALSDVKIPAFLLVSNRVLPGNMIGTASRTNTSIINVACGVLFGLFEMLAY